MDDDSGQFKILIEVEKSSNSWDQFESSLEKDFYKWTTTVFNYLKLSGNFEISVVLCDDAHIRLLNAQYRHQNKSTNILSFPSYNFNSSHVHFDEFAFPLGDLVISFERVQAEAHEQSKSFNDHLCHLWIHGLLHLMGYDHEIDEQAIIMENLEIVLLKTYNINNPYQDAGEKKLC